MIFETTIERVYVYDTLDELMDKQEYTENMLLGYKHRGHQIRWKTRVEITNDNKYVFLLKIYTAVDK